MAAVCAERGYRRTEWVMLDWHPAGNLHAAIGATVVEDRLPYRVTGVVLHRLARRGCPAGAASG